MPTKVNIPGVGSVNFPDEMSQDEITREVERLAGSTPQPEAESTTPSHPLARLGDFVTENLPAIAAGGATLATGGLAGIPSAVTAGAAGGAGRAILRLLQGKDPGTVREASNDALWEGGTQAIGGGLSKVLKLAGKGAYAWGLRPSTSLRREFPDIIKTGIREGIITPSATNKALTSSAADAKALIAGAKGAPNVSVREVASQIGPVGKRAKLRVKAGKPDEAPEMAARIRAMRRQNPQGMTVATTQDVKGELQDAATQIYKARDRGAAVNNLGGETDEAFAKGARIALEKRIPEIADVNARTQSLIGLDRAMADMEVRPQTLGRLMTGATAVGSTLAGGPVAGAGSALMMQALQSPRMQMGAGVAADRLGNVPWEQLIRAMLLDRLQSPQ